MADGGYVEPSYVQRLAGGGVVRGVGGPRQDNIMGIDRPQVLRPLGFSAKEFVVNAAQTAANRAQIETLNRGGKWDLIPRRANGGTDTAAVAGTGLAGGGRQSITLNIDMGDLGVRRIVTEILEDQNEYSASVGRMNYGTSILTNGLMTIIRRRSRAATTTIRPLARSVGPPAVGHLVKCGCALLHPTRSRWARRSPQPSSSCTSAATAQTGTVDHDKRIKSAVSFTKITWTGGRPPTTQVLRQFEDRTSRCRCRLETDVTAMMQSVSLGDPWYGFDVSSANLVPGLIFYGPTYATVDYRPRLEVTWSDAPEKPGGLAPSGGRAISGTKPIVRCDYVDVSGEVDDAVDSGSDQRH